jgi:hypothetical protein
MLMAAQYSEPPSAKTRRPLSVDRSPGLSEEMTLLPKRSSPFDYTQTVCYSPAGSIFYSSLSFP